VAEVSRRGLLARKIGMTRLFDEAGRVMAVTVLEAGPCVVVQHRTRERDGYEAVQLGFGPVKPSRVNRPMAGHFRRWGVPPVRHLAEFRWDGELPPVGSEVRADLFAPGDRVDVTGISKGKGFAGVIKRHHARRGPMSHGSKYHRRVGSLNAGTSPARVFKNRQMPGHMGAQRTTVKGLRVVRVDPERNLLVVRGAVPGVRGAVLRVRAAAAR
jgi:large subunit ribosomal protein L3